jgi:hypothetical protein
MSTPDPTNPRVRILGAGAVGARIARAVIAGDESVRVEIDDVDPAAASALAGQLGPRVQVVHDRLSALNSPSVLVVARPRPHFDVASAAVAEGVPVVSVSDDLDDLRDLLTLDSLAQRHGVPLVVGAATSPGLSGLIARHLGSRLDRLDEIHISIHGTGGPACAVAHHRALGGTSLNWHDGRWMERPAGSGRELAWFPDPLGAKDCYRAELADPLLLNRIFPEADRITARMSATRRDRLTARLPMLTPPHPEGGLGGVRVEVRGERSGERVALVAGIAQRTAIAAAHVATMFTTMQLRGELSPGLVLAGDAALPTQRMLERLAANGLALREFVGSN